MPNKFGKICAVQMHSPDGSTNTGQYKVLCYRVSYVNTQFWLRAEMEFKFKCCRNPTIFPHIICRMYKDDFWSNSNLVSH